MMAGYLTKFMFRAANSRFGLSHFISSVTREGADRHISRRQERMGRG